MCGKAFLVPPFVKLRAIKNAWHVTNCRTGEDAGEDAARTGPPRWSDSNWLPGGGLPRKLTVKRQR